MSEELSSKVEKNMLKTISLISLFGVIVLLVWIVWNSGQERAASSYRESLQNCLNRIELEKLESLRNDARISELLEEGNLSTSNTKKVVEFLVSQEQCDLDEPPKGFWQISNLELHLENERLVLKQ